MSETLPIPATSAIYLVDGHYQLFRAYHALQNLTNREGRPTNVAFGFLQTLRSLYALHAPEYLAVIFDAEGGSFRAQLYDAYKANRGEMEEEMRLQIPDVFRLLAALRIPALQQTGYEADDLIATLATRAGAQGYRVFIVSADKDLFQLVDDRISLLRSTPDQRDAELFTPAAVKEKMGVTPAQMVDFQAIVGDTSDNIPGIPGLGPKFAALILEHFPEGIASLYADPDWAAKLKALKGFGPSKIKAIEEQRASAEMSYELARLRRDVPLDLELPGALRTGEPDPRALKEVLADLDFRAALAALERGDSVLLPSAAGAAGARPIAARREEVSPPAEPAQPRPERTTDYATVVTPEALAAVADALRSAGHFAFDTETTGRSADEARMVGMSLSWRPNQGVYIPVGHDAMAAPDGQLSLAAVREALGPTYANSAITKVAHNAKYDLKILRRHGYKVAGLNYDTLLAAHLEAEARDSIGLKGMARDVLGIDMQPIAELIGTGRNQISMAEVAVSDAAPYACADADCTLQLETRLRETLRATPMERLLERVELPLVDVLSAMELEGIKVDVAALAALKDDFDARLEKLQETIHREAGEVFNLNSPKQVAAILFDKLGLPVQKKTKSGPSTDVSVLEALRDEHPVAELMLEYRLFEKLSSTYVDQLPKMVNRATGRIHCTFNQVGAATGRLSCNDPNLQNIPTRTEEGRLIRRAFVASAPDRVLLAADYSQIELRILAHITGEPPLVEAFAAGHDIHALTASKIYGGAPGDVTREQRGAGKTINFGIIYGMSAFRLARDLAIGRAEAQQFIDDYFRGYPRVAAWIAETKARVAELGYSETLGGRRRVIPDINSSNQNKRQAAERIAVNTPIQGTAADMIKAAMIEVDRRLAAELPACKMLLQVHDELVFDLPRADVARASTVIERAMREAFPLAVPIAVDIASGPTWADCK